MSIWSILTKPLRDFALIFYDDLEFRAMSLPRIACFALTATVISVPLYWFACGEMFPGYAELCAITGGTWGSYTVKRWRCPPEEGAARDDKESG